VKHQRNMPYVALISQVDNGCHCVKRPRKNFTPHTASMIEDRSFVDPNKKRDQKFG